jgi:hypothetical protein
MESLVVKKIKKVALLPTEYSSFRTEIRQYFVDKVLPQAKTFLDPWAGNASLMPYLEFNSREVYFNDILPLHYYINKAKTFRVAKYLLISERNVEATLKTALLDILYPLDNKKLTISSQWIDHDILDIFVAAWDRLLSYPSPLNDILRCLLILCVRPYSSLTSSISNPTWLKAGGMSTSHDISYIIDTAISILFTYHNYFYSNPVKPTSHTKSFFISKDAQFLNLSKKVDTIFTSPPYCNRLDIYRVYNPELFFLAHVDCGLTHNSILGTNTVKNYDSSIDRQYISFIAPHTAMLLSTIDKLGKPDENNYYLRYYSRYFSKLYRTLQNVLTSLDTKGSAYLVVQNNMHRGELIDMQDLLVDFFSRIGMSAQTVYTHDRHHLGKRNISAEYPAVIKKHKEMIIKAQQC